MTTTERTLTGIGVGRGIVVGDVRRMPDPLPEPSQVNSTIGAEKENISNPMMFVFGRLLTVGAGFVLLAIIALAAKMSSQVMTHWWLQIINSCSDPVNAKLTCEHIATIIGTKQ